MVATRLVGGLVAQRLARQRRAEAAGQAHAVAGAAVLSHQAAASSRCARGRRGSRGGTNAPATERQRRGAPHARRLVAQPTRLRRASPRSLRRRPARARRRGAYFAGSRRPASSPSSSVTAGSAASAPGRRRRCRPCAPSRPASPARRPGPCTSWRRPCTPGRRASCRSVWQAMQPAFFVELLVRLRRRRRRGASAAASAAAPRGVNAWLHVRLSCLSRRRAACCRR